MDSPDAFDSLVLVLNYSFHSHFCVVWIICQFHSKCTQVWLWTSVGCQTALPVRGEVNSETECLVTFIVIDVAEIASGILFP